MALSLFGLSILCPGCALMEDANRNVMRALTTPIETHRELARNRQWAENAWEKARASNGPREFSEDYALGFKDGYAEYLYRGGDGEPPLLAPKRYRHLRYQTPQGYLAKEDWFAGYRHGAGVAHDTGARRWITGPTGWLPEAAMVAGREPPMPHEQPDTLPMPQPLPKVGGDQRLPEGAEIEPAPPPVEPLRTKIIGVGVPPNAEPEPKATIKGISVPPNVEPETAVEQPRVRIRLVTPVMPKE